MKVTVGRKELLESVSLANLLVSGRAVEDTFKNVKIEAEGKSVSIYGTDRETIIKQTLEESDVNQKGAVVVPAQKVIDVLTKVLDDKITVTSDKGGESTSIAITTSRGNFKILGFSAEDFVVFPEIDWTGGVEVEPASLSDMIRKTIFAASAERTRYALNGVFVKLGEKKFEMVATDGKRLATIERSTGEKRQPLPGVIAPLKCMHLLERVCALAQSGGETAVSLKILENQICARTSNCVIISRLVEGHYPDYEAVIPKDCDKTLKIGIKEFAQLISEGAALGDKESQAVKFSFRDGKMSLSSRSTNADEAKVESDVSYEGDDLEIAFNPLYLQETLKTFDQVIVSFSFKDSSSAAVLSVLPVEEDKPLGYNYIYVVMPLDIH